MSVAVGLSQSGAVSRFVSISAPVALRCADGRVELNQVEFWLHLTVRDVGPNRGQLTQLNSIVSDPLRLSPIV